MSGEAIVSALGRSDRVFKLSILAFPASTSSSTEMPPKMQSTLGADQMLHELNERKPLTLGKR